ncbi:MAG: hypothetical protein D6689_03110 [Deltaproteobacteria bacterium]|nr:MAG: hypothetical protein D6689_03110 [Deltaproteobacteria bacterium]
MGRSSRDLDGDRIVRGHGAVGRARLDDVDARRQIGRVDSIRRRRPDHHRIAVDPEFHGLDPDARSGRDVDREARLYPRAVGRLRDVHPQSLDLGCSGDDIGTRVPVGGPGGRALRRRADRGGVVAHFSFRALRTPDRHREADYHRCHVARPVHARQSSQIPCRIAEAPVAAATWAGARHRPRRARNHVIPSPSLARPTR